MNKKQKNNGYQPLNSLDTVPPNIDSSVQLAITEELVNSLDNKAREEIRQLARKLDAVMRDLESVRGWQLCTKCKNHIDSEYINIVCMECVNGSKWEWRGVQEDES
mgnify:CR=1 FL=1